MARSSPKFDGKMQMREALEKTTKISNMHYKTREYKTFCEINEINWQDNYTLGEFARLEFVILKSLIGNNLSDALLVTFFLFGAE